MKAALGSAPRMFSASVSYWLRCASSVITMMSERLGQLGIALAPAGTELLDQREDVAVVLAQQLPQMRAAGRLGVLLGHRTAAANVL